jgi:hypothetical protein
MSLERTIYDGFTIQESVDSTDCQETLVEKVARRRAEDALKEIRKHYPEATIEVEVKDGRGILTACQGRFVLSKEFVETEESLGSPHCIHEYRRILQGKARLVLIVPRENASKTFLRMLEFNQWWLFYYQVFFYDKEGNIKRVDRKTWCGMMGRPYEPPPRAPEIA